MHQDDLRTLARAAASLGLGLGYMLLGIMILIAIRPRGGAVLLGPMLIVAFGFFMVGGNWWVITRLLRPR